MLNPADRKVLGALKKEFQRFVCGSLAAFAPNLGHPYPAKIIVVNTSQLVQAVSSEKHGIAR